MPDQTPILNTVDESSFVGLRSYTEAQAGKFFGRDEEIDQLIKLIASNTLTIVFGKSGTGKTSLLNAGVFPGLRKNYCLPFRIRLEFKEGSPDLITQIKKVLKTEIDNYGFKVDTYPGPETLWEYFHIEPLWKTITPILIFDQFEEIFTLAQKSSRFAGKELPLFWDELSCLIENFIPQKLRKQFLNQEENIGYDYNTQKVKVLFSFREEFLPEFESISARIPSLKYSRFRLLPLNGKKAYEVITKTWGNNINPLEADKIISFFTNDPDKNKNDLAEVEPSLLSQVCFHIEKERIRLGGRQITAELLNKFPKEMILRSIYMEALNESNAVVPVNTNKKALVPVLPMNKFIEDKLITDEGYRTSYVLTHYENRLMPGIEVLLQKYFLRQNDKTIELTHDVLTPLIKYDRESRRKKIAAAIANKKARRRGLAIFLLFLLAGILFFIFAKIQEADIQKKIIVLEGDRTKLDSVVKQLRSDSVRITLNNKDTSVKNTVINKKIDSLYNEIAKLKQKIDSIEVPDTNTGKLKKQLNEMEANYNALLNINTILRNQIEELRRRPASDVNALNLKIQDLQRQLNESNNKLLLWQTNFENLQKKFDAYRLKYPVIFTDSPKDNAVKPKENSLLLSLRTGPANNLSKPIDTLTIYLIPLKSSNKILRDAKYYDMFCSGLKIDPLNLPPGIKKANYYEGQYFYNDIPEGEYLVKICSYYGSSKEITWKGKMQKPITLPLKPPVK